MAKQVTVSAPARLHFGLFSIGQSLNYQFGGCGLMIDGPRTVVSAKPADRFSLLGVETSAAMQAVNHWYQLNERMLQCDLAINALQQIPLAVEIKKTPERHAGFGSGTQLALSVVKAITESLGLPCLSIDEMAISVGRGKRSAIGSHGFYQGGFLVDRGKQIGDGLAPLELRMDFPEAWPVVTILPQGDSGLSGEREKSAFERLPDSTKDERQAMMSLVKSEVVTGIVDRDYTRFADGLYRFGFQSGKMFETLQGGPYNGDAIQNIVATVREFGIRAVGQSSWGPCVFSIPPSIDVANLLVGHLEAKLPPATTVRIRQADNRGVIIS